MYHRPWVSSGKCSVLDVDQSESISFTEAQAGFRKLNARVNEDEWGQMTFGFTDDAVCESDKNNGTYCIQRVLVLCMRVCVV